MSSDTNTSFFFTVTSISRFTYIYLNVKINSGDGGSMSSIYLSHSRYFWFCSQPIKLSDLSPFDRKKHTWKKKIVTGKGWADFQWPGYRATHLGVQQSLPSHSDELIEVEVTHFIPTLKRYRLMFNEPVSDVNVQAHTRTTLHINPSHTHLIVRLS